MRRTLIHIDGMTIGHGKKVLYENVSFDIDEGDCIMLCGANGSGKTTLLKAIAGLQHPGCRVTMIPSRIPKVKGFSVKEFAEIYKDKPVQSMVTPCIFIHSVETIHTPELRNYAWWDEIIDIRCHPGRMQTDIQTWARSLGPIILDCVQQLTITNQEVKVKNANWRVESGVLHVIVNYRYRVLQKPDESPSMETFTYGERIK